MLIMLMLAELVAELPDKTTIQKSTMNMARCVQGEIDKLDDGISDAKTIAQGATAACGGARTLLRKSWIQVVDQLAKKASEKGGEPVSDEEKAANVEQAMTNLDASLAENSVRWVLQKRAAKPAKAPADPQ